jgi:two-component system, LytTR family, response regulator
MKTKIKSVIVDDESKSREVLYELLKKYCIDVVIVGEAATCKEAKQVIEETKPQLVFLDIQMPDGTGFNVLEDIDSPSFDVIFVTAYDQYAIKAFKHSAIDYLLKPVNPEDLMLSVERYKQRTFSNDINKRLDILMQNLHSDENTRTKKIVLSTSEGYHVVNPDDIIRCQSDSYYTNFHFIDSKRIMVSKTLKEFDEMLSEFGFVRCHKSHLVNVKHVKSFLRADGGYIIMVDGEQIPVSRRKRDYIVEILSSL